MSVLSGDKSEIGTKFSSEISESIRSKFGAGLREGTFNSSDSKCLVAFSRVSNSGFTVVALIPNIYFNSLSNDIGILVIKVGVICLIVSILFFTVTYRSITVPLTKLMGSMREIKKGNLKVRKVSENAKDEVGELASSYNEMINELNLHIENIKEKEKQKVLLEFRALQAQINPHFIANTLNSKDGEYIVIMITDTGVGMNDDEIKELLEGKQKSKDSFSSIGLKNVSERIKLSYGEHYGLSIKSQKDMFTTVEIKLPII